MEQAHRQRAALVAASQAAAAIDQLLRFAIDGDQTGDAAFDADVPELLLDAARLSLDVATSSANRDPQPDEDQGEIIAAISRYLEGWV